MADNSNDMEAIKAELLRRGAINDSSSSASSAPSDGGLLQNGDRSNSFGFMSHPLDNSMKAVHGMQDFAGGLMGSVQRGASLLSKGVEYPTHAAYEAITGNKVPHYDPGEMFGLAGSQPVDLNKTISHNPDSFMSKMGQFAPAIAAGGISLPGQMAANGLWGAIQADPNQTNSVLPNGRIGAGIEDATLVGAGGALLKYAPKLMQGVSSKIGDAINYLRPNQDAASFL